MLEELRVPAWLARGRRRVGPAAAVLRVPERFARALASHAGAAAIGVHLELLGATGVQVGGAARGGAVPALPAPRHHPHGEVVAVNEADVVEVEPVRAIEGELRQRGRRHRARPGALDGGGAAVARDADKPALSGVLGAEGAAPQAAGPGRGHGDGVGLAGLEGEPGGGELRGAGVGEDAGPDGVGALVEDREGC